MPYYIDLFQESPDETFAEEDWLEAIGDYQPGGGEAFSLENGEAVILVRIPWLKARSFLRWTLGWSYADKGAPYSLHREDPAYHPRFTWLTASSVTFNGLSPVGVEDVGTKVDGSFSGSLPIAKYAEIEATVRFTDKPWVFLPDEDIETVADEAQRNTYFDPVPSVEIISAEGLNNIAFANGSAANDKIPAPFGTLMSKMTKTLSWMWVPNEFVSGDDTLHFTPTKIDSCVGRVNSTEFLGHPAGTLLLQAPAFTRFRFPLQTAGGVYGYFGWNIRLPMQFFDPTRGFDDATLTTRTDDDTGVLTFTAPKRGDYVAGDGTVDIAWSGGSRDGMDITFSAAGAITVDGGSGDVLPSGGTTNIEVYDNRYRGHQLVPRRSDLKWYGAKRELGGKLFPEADFYNIFTHVDKP